MASQDLIRSQQDVEDMVLGDFVDRAQGLILNPVEPLPEEPLLFSQDGQRMIEEKYSGLLKEMRKTPGEDPDKDGLQDAGSTQNALVQYKHFHAMSQLPSVEQVENSSEGMAFWSHVGHDVGSRSKMAQCFNRALKHDPQANEIYKALSDDLKSLVTAGHTCICPIQYC